MKRLRVWRALALAAALAAALPPEAADTTVVGPVTRIELAADGRSAVATVKDANTGKDVEVTIR